jgi:nucleoside-diphosphate-sugar epimerase
MGHEVTVFHRGRTRTELPEGVAQILGDRRRLADHADALRRISPRVVLDMIPLGGRDARQVIDTFQGYARRLVAISSQDVYRAYGRLIGIEPGPVQTVPLVEDAALRSKLYPYRGAQRRLDDYEKILVERVVMGDTQIAGTIVRLPMVYGPHDRQHRLFEILKRIDDGRPAILLDEGLAAWRWTRGYVENVAEAVALAVADEGAAGRIYNAGEVRALSTAEWVGQIGQAAGWKGQVVTVSRDRLPAHLVPDIDTGQDLVADTTRIREELGYEEVVPREEALRRTIDWQRANPPAQFDAGQFDYEVEDEVLAGLG